MKKRRILSVILVLFLLTGLLAGCGAQKQALSRDLAMEAPAMAAESGNGVNTTQDAPLPEGRKWIVTLRISAETEDLDALTADLTEEIAAQEGYLEDQHVYNGSSHSGSRFRRASMTIRIPASRVDSFTEEMAGMANVVSREKSLEDVTLTYVATESRVKALETEEARLLELLAKAETMSDLLEIEARLTDVRYELESVTTQLRTLSNQIDYATVYLTVEEVREYTPVEEPTVWGRIRDGFVGSINGLGTGIVNATVWILANSPYLVILGAAAAGVAVTVKRVRRKRMLQKESKGA